jgi:hypothetical protein
MEPRAYFTGVDDSILSEAYIDRSLLSYSKFNEFIAKREKAILDHVRKELKITDADFTVDQQET